MLNLSVDQGNIITALSVLCLLFHMIEGNAVQAQQKNTVPRVLPGGQEADSTRLNADSSSVSAIISAASLEDLLRKSTVGIQVFDGSGLSDVAPGLMVRGTASFSINDQPLYILDGVYLSGYPSDLDPWDVSEVEIIPGAAGAALYGSAGGNGVVKITTHRHTHSPGEEMDLLNITIRSSVGNNHLPETVNLSDHHPFRTNGNFFLDQDGNPTTQPSSFESDFNNVIFVDNDFPDSVTTFNTQRDYFQKRPNLRNYLSLQGNAKRWGYFMSLSNTTDRGIVRNLARISHK